MVLSLTFSYQTLYALFPPTRAPRPHLPKNIRCAVQILKLVTTQFSPFFCYFLPLRPIYLPQHPIFKHYGSVLFLNVRDQVSIPYKTAGNTSSVYFGLRVSCHKTCRQTVAVTAAFSQLSVSLCTKERRQPTKAQRSAVGPPPPVTSSQQTLVSQ